MQVKKRLVNCYVVIIFRHYIIHKCGTQRSIRDQKVTPSGGHKLLVSRAREFELSSHPHL
jgi:hypothetical protein